MSLSTTCPQCLATLRYPQAPPQAKKVKCPKCACPMIIPGAQADPSFQDPSRNPAEPTRRNQPVEDESIVTPEVARPARSAPAARTRDESPGERDEGPRRGKRRDDPDDPDDLEDRPRRSRGARDDEDPDDRPRRRREPEEEEDRPRRRFVEDEDDDRSRPRAKKSRKGGKGLLIGLLIGGGVLVLGGVVVILLLVLGGSNRLVGKWRPERFGAGETVEFTRDGRLIVTGMGIAMEGRYRIIDSETVEIQAPLGFGPGGGRTEIEYYRFEGDVLIFSNMRGGRGDRFRRV